MTDTRDAGTSPAEALVTMALITFAGPVVVGLMTTVSAQAGTIMASSSNVADARLALAYVGRQVRSGHQPLTVSATTLSFATCSDQAAPGDLGRVRLVEFRISEGALRTRSHRVSVAEGDWRTLVAGLAADSGFTASGAQGVRVTMTANGTYGRSAEGVTMVSPRDAALPNPLPEVCP